VRAQGYIIQKTKNTRAILALCSRYTRAVWWAVFLWGRDSIFCGAGIVFLRGSDGIFWAGILFLWGRAIFIKFLGAVIVIFWGRDSIFWGQG